MFQIASHRSNALSGSSKGFSLPSTSTLEKTVCRTASINRSTATSCAGVSPARCTYLCASIKTSRSVISSTCPFEQRTRIQFSSHRLNFVLTFVARTWFRSFIICQSFLSCILYLITGKLCPKIFIHQKNQLSAQPR